MAQLLVSAGQAGQKSNGTAATLGDASMAMMWGLSCGTSHFLPYFYFVFFSSMILFIILFQLGTYKRKDDYDYPQIIVQDFDAHAELQCRIWNQFMQKRVISSGTQSVIATSYRLM